jgi:hypothetical protein
VAIPVSRVLLVGSTAACTGGAPGRSYAAPADRSQPIGLSERFKAGAVRAFKAMGKALLSFFESIASFFENLFGGGHSKPDRQESAERHQEAEPEIAHDIRADNVRADEAARTQRSQELARKYGIQNPPEREHELDLGRPRE